MDTEHVERSAAERLAEPPVDHVGSSMHVIENVPGLTYRMLDYWTRLGYVPTVSKPEPGSGRQRQYNPADYPMLRRAMALLSAGVKSDRAFPVARLETNLIADGVHVTFSRELLT